MAKKKRAVHGGKREGAGRKPATPKEGKTIPVSVSVPELLVQQIDDYAQLQSLTRSQAITEAIRVFTAKR